MTYVGGSLSNTSGVAPTSLNESLGTITVIWDTFPDNSSSFLTFDATLDFTVTPGDVITNNAEVTWTSLPGNVTTAQSAYNTLSTERTGDPANPGGAANDYRATDPASVTIINPQALDKTIVQMFGVLHRRRGRGDRRNRALPVAGDVDRGDQSELYVRRSAPERPELH